jgi:hypothetical protein
MCPCLKTLAVLFQAKRVLAVAARGVRLVAAHLGGEGATVALFGGLNSHFAELLMVFGVMAVHTVTIDTVAQIGETLAVQLKASALFAVALGHTHRRITLHIIASRWGAMMGYLWTDMSRPNAWRLSSLMTCRADIALTRTRPKHLRLLAIPTDSMASTSVAPALLRLRKIFLLYVCPCGLG